MDISKLLIWTGLGLLALGLTVKYAPWLVTWFGKLPGDFDIRNTHSRVFLPITSMIIVSLLLTLIINLLFRK
ncbi:MAG: DUF2905 family protein [Methylomonas sp.]|nr:DUF2905 family protein [Methylomonas sp.]